MFEIADRILAAIEGSAPRTVGTSMAFDGDVVIGSIAGGCVEGAVVEACADVLADGLPRTVDYGISDDAAFDVGLSCGGRLRIHIRLVTAADAVAASLRASLVGAPAGILSVLAGDPASHASRLDAELRASVDRGSGGLVTIDCAGDELEAFVEVCAPPPRIVIVGAMEFSSALAAAARVLGYRVTVCDPRPLFATAERFPGVELVVEWPPAYLDRTRLDERSVVCVLSHDARFDAEVIAMALASPAAFVGAMGSRSTHDRRVASLIERGVGPDAIVRLKSPIGLDLGSSTPEETAVSILAEIVAERNAASARPLSHTTGPIHRPSNRAIGVHA